MTVREASPGRPWRVLAGVWAVVLLGLGAGLGTLQVLGPLPHPIAAPAPAATETTLAPRTAQAVAPTGVAAPDSALLDAGLPRIATDGRMARVVYAAPSPAITDLARPRIALLLSGFGLSDRDSRSALESLPGPIAFAVSAYANEPAELMDRARAAGHELLASIPMEPHAYPQNDAGPRSLRTGLSAEENRANLDYALAHTPGAVGATAASDGMRGERFAEVGAALDPILDEIGRRGLLYVDPRPGRATPRPGLPTRSVDVILDDQLGRAEIDARLVALERTARERGSALGLGGPLRPATIERIAAWTKTLQDRGLLLVPVSALVTP